MTTNIMVSLGGNAILKHTDKGTAQEQLDNIRQTSNIIVELLEKNYHIALTHGNGPQVGDILLAYDLSKNILPPMPLDVCVAQSQGMIGYMLQISLKNALKNSEIEKSIVTIVTQTLVHEEDPLLKKPSKPIGPFYTAMEASKNREERGWVIVDDSGRGYRRVVPSPLPIGFVEESSIKFCAQSESSHNLSMTAMLVLTTCVGLIGVYPTRGAEYATAEAATAESRIVVDTMPLYSWPDDPLSITAARRSRTPRFPRPRAVACRRSRRVRRTGDA